MEKGKGKPIRRKVIAVFGEFGDKTDFVIEPVCFDECKCEECEDAFWITKIEK